MRHSSLLLDRRFRSWALFSVLITASVLGAPYLTDWFRSRETAEPDSAAVSEPIPTLSAISALGRLEPQGEVTILSAPSSLDGTTTRVEQLLVKEGDWIEAGQVVAVLDIQGRRLAAFKQAQTAVQIAEAELSRVRAGAKSGDIDAQKAAIARLEAELSNAQLEYERFDGLYKVGAISASERDSKRLVLETTEAQLQQARSALDGIVEVRPVDVQVAQAELASAIAQVAQAETELEATYIRAPLAGQVLKIHARPGEIIDAQGILELGKTSQMVVVAEVYETDISRVQIGQPAVINSSATSERLRGTVSQIGLQVSQQETFALDPAANTDNRVVEVRIQLDADSSQQVSHLSNLQVNVIIQG
ncbi:MAG: ABC exporter membrane fusion protein [Leptolyngbya sp. SIO4C1]|nr:ABC exporter membrane fusion protein [Leptolyngbya sp. SIO4C1]